MNFRAIFGRDLISSLESGYYEMPVDRLGAFSRSGRLGTCLWRLKWAYDPTVYAQTIDLLAEDCFLDTERGKKLCEMVLREWLNPHCQACNGAKEVIIGDKRLTCPSCEGLGVKRFSNRERAEFMQMPVDHWRRIAKLYQKVLNRLTRAERLVGAQMHYELER